MHARGVIEIARRQHALITTAQLRDLGWGRGAIQHAVAQRWLHRVHVGVFSVTPVLTPHARWLAATLASNGVLSHESAAALHGLAPQRRPQVDVIALGRADGRPGIVVHRAKVLTPSDRTRRHGIPVTSPTRTLVDLAAQWERGRLLDLAMELLHRRQLDVSRVLEARALRRPGARSLDALLEQLDEGTRSKLERTFFALCRHGGLPRPATQHRLAKGHHVDFAWPERRVAVETDSWTWHGNVRQWNRDHDRDARAVARGWQVLRFTRVQVEEQPVAVLSALRAALERAA
ncbi:type IV toxin-antitoxin system AbiEi family antitoxin [Conexibacter sp. SYSU D00693]|uniref:type IV toxin-antitoxin system AbiEi family antitoxin n=1 Tax=Conexibacter sp. SYSU D00693 TaxID=2812560 RepID=UPI00196B00FF|nr:DUF559 domain-containing protein [Conexibacter sp. SYSU D00693]